VNIAEYLKRSREDRAILQCRGCGYWVERQDALLAVRFLLEHVARCPATGKREETHLINLSDLALTSPPAVFQWHPDPSPVDEELRQSSFSKHTDELPDRVIGVWHSSNPCGAWDWTIVLEASGTGSLQFSNMGWDNGRQSLDWGIDDNGDLYIAFPGSFPFPSRSRVEIGLFSDEYGVQTEILRIFHETFCEHPLEFTRSKRSSSGNGDSGVPIG